MSSGYGAQGTQEAVGRVLSHSAEICPWSGRDGLTGQDRTEAEALGLGGGGATDGSRWGVDGRQETDEAWTGRKRRTRWR